ncbi:MAG: tRNA (N6-isopentenyl adenosine(37)-C2)-methylthiotransferase MiaB [Clostridiales bacterium]
MRYFIQTFGCQMNENDSALIASLLQNVGYRETNIIAEADIIVVNTCCVRQTAENRALGFIGSIKKLKEENPQLIIIVCGCMAQKDGTAEALSQKARHVGIIIGTFAAAKLPEYIEAYRASGHRIIDIAENYENENLSHMLAPVAPLATPIAKANHKAQVNIIYGCNNFCSYCIVPYVRGRERSRHAADIVAEVESLVQAGVREVQLLGQNVNSYGKDMTDGVGFGQLLQKLNRVEGLSRLRFMTSHPRDFTQPLVETIAGLDKVCHQFHLPIQSGCDRILDLMNRGYDTAYYRRLINNIRQILPDAVITSDLLVGFPGETEEDFQQTLDFIEECRLDAAYTFLYSRRSGTPAADMPNQITDEIKKQRLQKLMEIQNPISLAINQKMIGTNRLLLVDGVSKNNPNLLSGRDDGNKIVIFPGTAQNQSGDLLEVKITEAKTWNMYGELV